MWYDPNNLLSYNRVYNFCLGGRGTGKTFGYKKWCISDFKKNGKMFGWVRRYGEEIKEIKRTFFDDIIAENIFPDDDFKVKGDCCYINGEIFGYFFSLNSSGKYKSSAYPKINKIIYDEVISEKGYTSYLKSEPEKFDGLFETIARKRNDVRAFFLANAVTRNCPYFHYHKIYPSLEKEFNSNEHIVIQMWKNKEFEDEKKNTKFGKMITEKRIGKFIIGNEFIRDNNFFIEKKSSKSYFIFGMKYNDFTFGFWVDKKNDKLYMSEKYDKQSNCIYALTTEDHSPNLIMLMKIKNNYHIKLLLYCFEFNRLYFENQKCKGQFYEFIDFIGR